jgi:hypothetical protein
MAESEIKHLPLPKVEQGVLLGFVCPKCLLFSQKFATGCGCYACSFCGHHVPTPFYAAACNLVGFLVNHPSPQ